PVAPALSHNPAANRRHIPDLHAMSSRPDDWSRVRETFEAAVALPADGRPAYLSRTCGGDSALRQQVEALLTSHECAKSFLETPAVPPLTDAQTTRLEG